MCLVTSVSSAGYMDWTMCSFGEDSAQVVVGTFTTDQYGSLSAAEAAMSYLEFDSAGQDCGSGAYRGED